MEYNVIFEEPTSGLKVQTTILNNCISTTEIEVIEQLKEKKWKFRIRKSQI